ncbi:MAG: M48 family metalloprotease [Nitrososphaerota archaeon]|uniref:zinc metalloprotease HtpX n=1 Tax=Candidatus Bathycorpusculum sp. TaxID=2994959 RepID=UPI00283A732E|nr:zinc metalloprotease HtpX [Candidatus Termitimicrobium sp.]MCL2432190.1 zinc metalloprotease HtpX [Candidatus Termitimicrobium sp.]MDR0493779.1 M48 family metalloprotease [Nitrososphaerota archaeon]
MANLSQLKSAMAVSIFLSAFIFGLLLIGIIYFLGMDLYMGLFIAIGGSALFILFQYAIGPAIVVATTRLHYLKPGENPWLEKTVKELSDKTGIPLPKLATVPSNTPNAFTFGRSTAGATLAVHEGLLKQLNEGEIRGVIAHELGHIKHKDYIVMTVLSALPLITYYIAQVTLFAGVLSGGNRRRSNNKDNSGAILLVIGVVSYVVYIITFLIVMRLSRLREHYADAFSAYLTGSPRNLQSALSKITYGLSIAPPKSVESARAFYIEDPDMAKQSFSYIMNKKDQYDLNHDGVLDERELELAMEKEAKTAAAQMHNLFSTHPATFKRILLLREIEEEMETGQYSSDKMYSHV